MKIVFIGTVEFSKKILEKLISLKADISGVLTKEESDFNSDFVDLSGTCKRHGIPYKYVSDINSTENVKWIENLKPDIIFCFGFSQILKKEILNVTPIGVVGFHPAELPQNRGRHPIVWALVLGLKKTASTFFFMDEGADSGDLLSQEKVLITYEDNARSLLDKITNVALRQIEEILPKLQKKTFNKIPQDHAKSNYWRKRGNEDGKIDFRMDARTIYNLVRGLTRPYVGAHIVYKNKEIKVWVAEEQKVSLKNVEYGKVLNIINGSILVKCAEGAILLTEHEFKNLPEAGEYLL